MAVGNPYAAPQFPGDGPGGASPIGAPIPWTPSEVIGIAWNIFKEHWVVLFFAPLIALIVGQIPGQATQAIMGATQMDPESPEAVLLLAVGTLVGSIVGTFFQVGQIRLWLQAARGETPEFGVIFSGIDRFLPVLLVSILMGIGVLFGMLLLIVPGIILAIGWFYSTYFVVDRGLAPVEALKASWELTNGHKTNIFLLMLLSIPVALLGYLACCIGVVASISVISIAYTLVYLRLTGQPSRSH